MKAIQCSVASLVLALSVPAVAGGPVADEVWHGSGSTYDAGAIATATYTLDVEVFYIDATSRNVVTTRTFNTGAVKVVTCLVTDTSANQRSVSCDDRHGTETILGSMRARHLLLDNGSEIESGVAEDDGGERRRGIRTARLGGVVVGYARDFIERVGD